MPLMCEAAKITYQDFVMKAPTDSVNGLTFDHTGICIFDHFLVNNTQLRMIQSVTSQHHFV